ncbi:hypothetical protein G6F70_003804 [Rhizopus microsporus]|nr:hypothetical protein G6F71_003755 [Rhizopus microsporus]KAG1200739.1 hypothetical protein G6F70_003804 [Rhizopus microsporus]KAG1212531.1 hypothetical protein G6F69_003638 [Rhizopus microsporus]KAG1234481.1 hypothetical protein G6F67_003510 [Rhizopus microsporus]KAG1266809.1 hypothetical protein G6F68_002460 [Rhizopus microsporus]
MESKKRKRKDNGNRLKCDGLRPCMQCKARAIACSFYKDGSLETDESETTPGQITSEDHNESVDNSTSNTVEQAIFFSESVDEQHTKLKRKGPMLESRVSNMFACLCDALKKTPSLDGRKLSQKLWPPAGSFGNFISWSLDPPLPSRYAGSIEMPSTEIQMALIDCFFRTRNQVQQCIIPSYFYEQLKVKGLFITPLLLNAIYASSARFVNIPDCPKPDIFYHRAKRLIEDFMDVPRLSTVVAAYLLSLYEPSADVYRPGSYHCRQWSLSGMACRMAIELGLHDESDVDPSLSPVEKELRRRVLWACYDLDKLQSLGWERPWTIRRTYIRTKFPSPLPEETSEDQYHLKVFLHRIKFALLVEEELELRNMNRSTLSSLSEESASQDEICSIFTTLFNKYIDFFYSLPTDMQWTPTTPVPVEDVLQLPKPDPVVAHVHLQFNIILIELLTKIPATEANNFQLRVAAASITQLAYFLCQEPAYIIKFDFIAHALIHAIKVHMLQLDGSDISVVQLAWCLFYRCIYCLQKLNTYVVIPNCHKFLQQVIQIYGIDLSDPYLDLKYQVPKPISTTSHYGNQQGSFSNYAIDDRTRLFQYHHPSSIMQSSIWPSTKPSIPIVTEEVTVPSQLNTSRSGIYSARWQDGNNDEQQQDSSKPNVYMPQQEQEQPPQTTYSNIMDGYH